MLTLIVTILVNMFFLLLLKRSVSSAAERKCSYNVMQLNVDVTSMALHGLQSTFSCLLKTNSRRGVVMARQSCSGWLD